MPVLIVDDHPGFRAAAVAIAGSCPGFTVAGELATGEQAAGRIGSTGAALVLMDLSMPGIGGAGAARRIRATHPRVVIVLPSDHGAGDLAGIAAGCGAHACLPKQGSGRGWPRSRVRCAAAPVPAEQEPSRRATQRHPASEPVILTWIPGRCPSSTTVCRHQPTLIAAARSQTTASSPRGTFSQAGLTANHVITRYHPVLSVPVVTIPGMAGDQETVTAATAVAAGGDLVPRAGARPPAPVAIAAELPKNGR